MSAMAADANAAAVIPNNGTPVIDVIAKAEIAPTNIIPSTPRFITPDLSATSSPKPAKTSGVPAPIIAATIEMRVCIFPLGRP